MIRTERNGSCVCVELEGEMDHCSARIMKEAIEKAIDDVKVKSLILDLKRVSFMDSSGVGMLIGRYKTMSERGGCVFAAGMTSQTEKLFRMAGLHRIIKIVEDKERVASDE